jgi:hypothetical protein
VPRITDFCISIYVFVCKLSLFRLCRSDFGITPVDDIFSYIFIILYYIILYYIILYYIYYIILYYRLIDFTKYLAVGFLCCQFNLFILLTRTLLSPLFSLTRDICPSTCPICHFARQQKQLQNSWFIYLNLVFSHLELKRRNLAAFELNCNKRLIDLFWKFIYLFPFGLAYADTSVSHVL